MGILQSLILSIIEGITEFLPISSTGHLILASNLLSISQTEFVKTFEIAIQLGAILAVVFLYWKKLLHSFALWKKIITAFIPAAFVGFIFFHFIKEFLIGNALVVLISLFLGGIALIVLEKYHKENVNPQNLENISYKNALIIGLFQSISVIPGVSRAAATIVGGMLTGLRRREAVEFSFLLAIPTMFAATTLDILKTGFIFNSGEIAILIIGFIGAFVTAIASVAFLLSFVKKHNFVPFAIYRLIVSLTFLVFLF